MKEAARSSLASDFPKRIIDQGAETRKELLSSGQWDQGEAAFDHFAEQMCRAKRWEKVYKKVGGRLFPAYRRAKSKA